MRFQATGSDGKSYTVETYGGQESQDASTDEAPPNERQVRLPEWSTDVYNWTAVGGIVLIPAVVAVLAIRAYLPGTGRRPSKLRGFPLDGARPSGPA